MLIPENVGKTFTFHCLIHHGLTASWNDSFDFIQLEQMEYSFNRFSHNSPSFCKAIYEKNGPIEKQLRRIIDNTASEDSDAFYANIIAKAEVFQNDDGGCFFWIKEIVSETRSKYFPIRPEKEEDIF